MAVLVSHPPPFTLWKVYSHHPWRGEAPEPPPHVEPACNSTTSASCMGVAVVIVVSRAWAQGCASQSVAGQPPIGQGLHLSALQSWFVRAPPAVWLAPSSLHSRHTWAVLMFVARKAVSPPLHAIAAFGMPFVWRGGRFSAPLSGLLMGLRRKEATWEGGTLVNSLAASPASFSLNRWWKSFLWGLLSFAGGGCNSTPAWSEGFSTFTAVIFFALH